MMLRGEMVWLLPFLIASQQQGGIEGVGAASGNSETVKNEDYWSKDVCCTV